MNLLPFLTGPVNAEAFGRFAREAARASRAALEGSMRATVETDFSHELASLDVPTLVVVGCRHEFMTVDLLQEEIAAKIKGARMVILDCGHEIPLERPRELAGLVEAFLALPEKGVACLLTVSKRRRGRRGRRRRRLGRSGR